MRQALVLRLCAWLLACLLGAAAVAADKKSGAATLPEVPETLTPAQADAFLAKLTDAQARALLARELHTKAQARATPPPEAAVGLGPLIMDVVEKLEATQVDAGRSSTVLAQGLADFPGAISPAAARVFGGPGGAAGALAVLAVALLAGVGASRALRRPLRRHGLEPALAADAGAAARFAAAALRFALDLVSFAGFSLVVLVLAHAFTTAQTSSRMLVAVYVSAAILIAGAAVLLRLVLAPHWRALRPVPLIDDDARFLYRWLLAIGAVTIFGSLSAQLFIRAGMSGESGVILTLIAGSLTGITLIAMMLRARMLRFFWRMLGVAYVLVVSLLWAGALLDGRPSPAGAAAASLGILLAFPLLDYWIGRAIADIVGEAPADSTLRRQAVGQPLRWAMRVLLAVMLFTAAGELWGFQLFEWQAKLRQALLGASFDLVAAFAVAVLGWQFIKIVIDRRLEAHEVNGVRVEPSQRLRTLLPLARVFLVTALIVITVMLVLSALGVNIAPLLAGAGIVGLAIGFGAQTLVRDIITGVFLIMDDAFRVGEYIQSGNYKGTVESIGLRSVKLRHHRGPIYVVPFGELRGVQNVSRDWVITKLTVGITYDSDLEKARKLVKKIGQELAADPELASDILEPLKMQGVEEFGDFAIQIRMKIMTKPGDKQFMIRRRAFAMIKKAFDANGIKFAFPTVQVAGGAETAVAAAATRLPSVSGEHAA
ncbi:MAG TPA: mechanosensitive ion channel family protein [Burkholderiales bacterium]|nr:mechanosensitive ion channel family protein [Burkholderiales bacterium]